MRDQCLSQCAPAAVLVDQGFAKAVASESDSPFFVGEAVEQWHNQCAQSRGGERELDGRCPVHVAGLWVCEEKEDVIGEIMEQHGDVYGRDFGEGGLGRSEAGRR